MDGLDSIARDYLLASVTRHLSAQQVAIDAAEEGALISGAMPGDFQIFLRVKMMPTRWYAELG